MKRRTSKKLSFILKALDRAMAKVRKINNTLGHGG